MDECEESKESVTKNSDKKSLVIVKRAGEAYSATIVRNGIYDISQHRRQKGNQYIDKNGNRADYSTNDTKKAENVNKTLKKAKQIVVGNFNAKMRDDFITLTYAIDTTDYKQVKKDFNLFIDRLQYEYSTDNPKNKGKAKHKHGFEFEYIKIMDVSAKGNLHIHLLLKDKNGRALRLNQATIERIWGHGLVKLKKIYEIRGLANYLCNLYVKTKDGGKRADRVPLYPKGMRVYSLSKGIDNLKKVDNTASIPEIMNKTRENDGTIYEVDIHSKNGDYVNTVTRCNWVEKNCTEDGWNKPSDVVWTTSDYYAIDEEIFQ